jgi:hypothetical protein
MKEIKPAVFGIIKNQKLIYVNESDKPHIAIPKIVNELKLDDLTAIILEYVDDESTRIERKKHFMTCADLS